MDIEIEGEPKPKKATKKKVAKKVAKKAKPSKGDSGTKKPIKPAKKEKKAKEPKAKVRRTPYKLSGTKSNLKVDTGLIAEVEKFAKSRKLSADDAADVLIGTGLSRLATLARYAKKDA